MDRPVDEPTWIAELARSIDPPWLSVTVVRVGPIPRGEPTPDRFVTISRNQRPFMRIDVYSPCRGRSPFSAAIVWNGLVVVGLDYDVHLVSLAGTVACTISLDSYFASLHPQESDLVVATGGRVYSVSKDARTLWRSELLAFDGVTISLVTDDVIEGQAAIDPPDDWQPFRLDRRTGAQLSVPE